MITNKKIYWFTSIMKLNEPTCNLFYDAHKIWLEIFQFLSNIGSPEIFGEIGVIFNIPQPFTVRTKRLSQVIRISHNNFKQLLHPDSDDGKIIVSNFIKVRILKLFNFLKIDITSRQLWFFSTASKWQLVLMFGLSSFSKMTPASQLANLWNMILLTFFWTQHLKSLKKTELEEMPFITDLLDQTDVEVTFPSLLSSN